MFIRDVFNLYIIWLRFIFDLFGFFLCFLGFNFFFSVYYCFFCDLFGKVEVLVWDLGEYVGYFEC